jgi:hypothetical protein
LARGKMKFFYFLFTLHAAGVIFLTGRIFSSNKGEFLFEISYIPNFTAHLCIAQHFLCEIIFQFLLFLLLKLCYDCKSKFCLAESEVFICIAFAR